MINQNINDIIIEAKNSIIVAATKYASISDMKELYKVGITNFGENRVDSFLGKYDVLNGYDITWHFIGHLQRNKANKVINKIDYLHSLDSLELAKIIEKYRIEPLNCFIQINISDDANKYGIKENELNYFINELKKFSKINVVGLMTILKEGLSKEEKTAYFSRISELSKKYNLPFTSMGMSSDYKEALECNATYIRLGSILLGEQNVRQSN